MRTLVSDALWQQFEPLIPKHPRSPKGGRPRKNDRVCLEGLVYMARGGLAWDLFPSGQFGIGKSTCFDRFSEWSKAGVFAQTHLGLLNELGLAGRIDNQTAVVDSASVRAVFGGPHTGPSPVDRSKNGCKRHIIADANGTPLLVRTTPANVRDEVPVVQMVKDLPAIKQPVGRPRQKPKELIGDRGYGFPWIIVLIVAMRIKSLLCPRGSPHGSGLGRRRYVIERTMSWFGNFRRIKVCYEKTPRHWQSMNELAACLICAGKIRPPRGGRRVFG